MFQTTNQKNPHQFPRETSPSYGISMLYPHSQDLQLLRFLHQAVQSSFLHRCDVQRIIMCCWNVLLKWIVVILCYNMFVVLLYDVPHWCFKATFGCHLAIMDRLWKLLYFMHLHAIHVMSIHKHPACRLHNMYACLMHHLQTYQDNTTYIRIISVGYLISGSPTPSHLPSHIHHRLAAAVSLGFLHLQVQVVFCLAS